MAGLVRRGKMEKAKEISCQNPEQIDPRIRRTRKLLQDALRSLLLEKPLVDISVADIAVRATVNRATFYAHYPDKQALAIALFKADLHDAIAAHFAERVPLTHDSLVEMAEVVFAFLAKLHGNCPKAGVELQDTVGTALQEDLYLIMEGWLPGKQELSRLFAGSSRETVATVVSWSIYGGAYRWSKGSRHIPARIVCQEIVSLLLPAQPSAPIT